MTRLNPEQRRRQLVVEAMKAFGSRGFERTSLDTVAEAAGVRKQTLLYYFASKEDLFEACVDELASQLSRTLEEVLVGPEEGWARVESIIRSVFDLAESTPELPLFAREGARHSPDVVRRVADQLEPLRKRALNFLERGMEDGLFRTQDPGLLLFTMYTAIVGSLTEAGVLRAFAGAQKGSSALRKREDELVHFVRRALEP
jgi:TetR/AcrR family transcriptional regulator